MRARAPGSAIDGIVSSIHGLVCEGRRISPRRTRARCRRCRAPGGCVPTTHAALPRRAAPSTPAKARQRRHRVVDLRERAVRADVLDAADDLRLEVHADPAGRAAFVSDRRSTRRARAAIVSPDASVTPVATPSAASILATSAPVLISTPACARGCSERVGQTRRVRRRRTSRWPPDVLRRAPSISSTAALPADHGPRNDPRTPPAAMVARSGSLSNHSLARSASRHRHPPQQAVGVGLAERSERASRFQQLDDVAGGGTVDRGRQRATPPRAARALILREAAQEARVLLRVLRGKRDRIACARARRVVPQDQRARRRSSARRHRPPGG